MYDTVHEVIQYSKYFVFQALIVGETASAGVGECMSSATAALMGQVPPPHFCSTVVRLIALQILAIGVSRTCLHFVFRYCHVMHRR
jgi:hypothetical protein